MFQKKFFLIIAFLFNFNILSKDLLLIGDSLSAGYQLEKNESWVELIRPWLFAEYGIKIDNISVSGATSNDFARNIENYFTKKYDYIVIELGANDGLRGLSTQDLYSNLSKIIEVSLSHTDNVALFDIQIPTNYGQRYRQNFSDVFVNLNKNYKIFSLEFFMLDIINNQELLLNDGIHPNAQGQNVINKFMQAEFKRWLND